MVAGRAGGPAGVPAGGPAAAEAGAGWRRRLLTTGILPACALLRVGCIPLACVLLVSRPLGHALACVLAAVAAASSVPLPLGRCRWVLLHLGLLLPCRRIPLLLCGGARGQQLRLPAAAAAAGPGLGGGWRRGSRPASRVPVSRIPMSRGPASCVCSSRVPASRVRATHDPLGRQVCAGPSRLSRY